MTKRFGAHTAVDCVSLSVGKGEILSLLGPPGCGKTTLLRLLGGFERPDSGCIYLGGRDITDLPPGERRVHTVFQNYALFPTMTVRENVAFALGPANPSKSEISGKVDAMLEMVGMAEHAGKYPNQISGDQKLRVSIAKVLVDRPLALLLDEPLSALAPELRGGMLAELGAIHDKLGIAFVYATRDPREAAALSGRIAVLDGGRVAGR